MKTRGNLFVQVLPAALILLSSQKVDAYNAERTSPNGAEVSKNDRDNKKSTKDLEPLFEIIFKAVDFLDASNKLAERNTSFHDKEHDSPKDHGVPGVPGKEKILRPSPVQGTIRFPLSEMEINNTSSNTAEPAQSDDTFVFPDEIDRLKPSIRPAPICQGSTFCETTQYYPEHLVNMAIESNDSLKLLASEDMVSNVVQRIDFSSEVPLCVSTEQVVYPKSAETKDNEWLYVVNQQNFKQGVRIETCSREDTECNLIDNVAVGYKMVCKQKYVYRQLVAVSNSGTILPQLFRFPSSCCCQAHFEGYPRTRSRMSGDAS